jgi:hypothetical protein
MTVSVEEEHERHEENEILAPTRYGIHEQVNLMFPICMYNKARPYLPDPYPFHDDAYEFMSLVCRTRRKTYKHTRIMHKE